MLRKYNVLATLFVAFIAQSAMADEGETMLEFAQKKPHLSSIAILATGGTIAERRDPSTGAAVPAVSAKDLVDSVPGLSDLANIGVLQVSNIDSSQMTPMDWARLSQKLDAVLAKEDIHGAIVTHGTDTMAEGAFFVDVTLNSDKPVVFTGAMRNASSADPDGPFNLRNAVIQVLSPNATHWGVTVSLNNRINSARDVRKTHTTNVQAFDSGEKGYLGQVFDGSVRRFNDRTRRIRLPLPDPLPDTFPDVAIIKDYAGFDGRLLRYAIDHGAAGVVVEGVGAGNVNAETFKAITYALSKDIPVVITTRVPQGSVEPIYGDAGGGATDLKAGAILAGDLPSSKARLLLMLGLIHRGNDHSALSGLFAD